MHVREIPEIVFRELVPNPLSVNTREVAIREFSLDRFEAQYYPDVNVVVGEVEGFGLTLHKTEGETGLWVCDSLKSAISTHYPYDAAATLTGGNRRTGTWAYNRGEQTKQSVWLTLNAMCVAAEELHSVSEKLKFIGKIATRSSELVASEAFEFSNFFEGDVR